MSFREIMISKAMDSGGRMVVRSALNPILWLCGLVTIPALATLAWPTNFPVWLTLIICIFAFLPVATAIFGFLYLLMRDPDKLQSEDYQIRKRSLEIIEQKGDTEAILATTVTAIENPNVTPELPESSDGEL